MGKFKAFGNLAIWGINREQYCCCFSIYLYSVGSASEASIWFINEGREYIEAPRWADIGIVVVVLVFYWNVFATYITR